MAAKLKRFEIKPGGDGNASYTFHIEDEAGKTLEVIASHEQLDVLADHLDDILMHDEAADEVEDEGE